MRRGAVCQWHRVAWCIDVGKLSDCRLSDRENLIKISWRRSFDVQSPSCVTFPAQEAFASWVELWLRMLLRFSLTIIHQRVVWQWTNLLFTLTRKLERFQVEAKWIKTFHNGEKVEHSGFQSHCHRFQGAAWAEWQGSLLFSRLYFNNKRFSLQFFAVPWHKSHK
jgi:hypothetical protein